jgi:hypothetical protein
MDHKYRASQALAAYVINPQVDQLLPNPLDKEVARIVAGVFSI